MTEPIIHRDDKTGCSVQVVADSISPDRIRLTTVQLRYWRPIHSELMTHRVFSRNARSSRAVPVVTLLKENPYIPEFGANQKGMQAGEELDEEKMKLAKHVWLDLIGHTRSMVKELQELGVHKQWANRPLEWFGWIDVLVTSTDWANWFALRDHPDAAPEIHALAETMQQAMNASDPAFIGYGQWHMPYILPEEMPNIYPLGGELQQLLVLSAARCARLSYKPFDGEPDYEKELARYDRLVKSEPVHASPTEHQATPDFLVHHEFGKGQVIRYWQDGAKQGNFVGWKQARKDIASEAVMDEHHNPEFYR